MSISLYYTAKRSQPLTDGERIAVAALIDAASVDDDLLRYANTGRGLNWESFCVYEGDDPTEANVVFEGATKLPDNSEDAVWTGLQHWASLLSRIRVAVPGAVWAVHVEDHDLVWDEASQAYDPAQ